MYFADESGSNSGILFMFNVTMVQKMGFVLDMISIFLFLTPSTETFIFGVSLRRPSSTSRRLAWALNFSRVMLALPCWSSLLRDQGKIPF